MATDDPDGKAERMQIIIDHSAIAMRCLFSFHDEIAIQTSQLRDGRTEPCSGTLRDGRPKPCNKPKPCCSFLDPRWRARLPL